MRRREIELQVEVTLVQLLFICSCHILDLIGKGFTPASLERLAQSHRAIASHTREQNLSVCRTKKKLSYMKFLF